MSALAALILLAEAIAPTIGFAPPTDRALRYETIEIVDSSGQPQRFTMQETVRFARTATGYRMTMTLDRASADAPLPRRRLFDAAMAPMIGRAIEIEIDAAGRPVDVIDGEALWARIVAAQRTLAASATAGAERDAVAGLAEMLAATPAEEQRARLLEPAWELIGLSGAARGARPGGDVRFESSDTATARFAVGETGRYTVSRATGLTLSASTTRALPGGAGRQARTLTQLP